MIYLKFGAQHLESLESHLHSRVYEKLVLVMKNFNLGTSLQSKFIMLCTGLSISAVEFPSVVICSQGMNIQAIIAAMYYYILGRLNTTTTKEFNLTPFQSADLTMRHIMKVSIYVRPRKRLVRGSYVAR